MEDTQVGFTFREHLLVDIKDPVVSVIKICWATLCSLPDEFQIPAFFLFVCMQHKASGSIIG